MENFGYLYSIAVAAGGVAGYVRKGNNRVAKQSAVYCSLPCHQCCQVLSHKTAKDVSKTSPK